MGELGKKMNISGFYYLMLLSIVALIYWRVSYKFQWIWLLIASVFSYCISASWKTLAYVIINVLTVYFATMIFKYKPNYKKIALVICLTTNIGILAVLKYMQIGSTIAYILFGIECEIPKLVSSLAISFYLLQLISYLLDTYWQTISIEKNPFKLLLYTIYFPLMVSGPINRYNTFGVSLFREHRFDYIKVSLGLKRIAWGMLKTLVISYGFQIITDEIFNNYTQYNGIIIFIAICVYTFQLYMNFSGCMDIVIGSSQCLGIELEENFNNPLQSRTVQEFWQRWHITLGGFAKDYVMNPILKTNVFIKFNRLCKNKFGKKTGKKIPSYVAVFIVWIVIGIWHGGAFKYIIGEGLWFGTIIILENVLKPVSDKIREKFRINIDSKVLRLFQIIRTYILVSFGMLYFRADSFNAGNRILANMMNFSREEYAALDKIVRLLQAELGNRNLLTWILCIIVVCLKDKLPDRYKIFINSKLPMVKYLAYWGWLIIILNFMKIFSGGFVYEQF